MPDWLMLGLALAYLGLLFLIAWIGDRQTGLTGGRAPIVYSLSIGVYCTSWTLYGAVGVAAHSGLNYLAIYVGPILVMLVGWRLIARMVRIAKAENLVSISDFIAARYGKSHTIAVLVTLSATVGLLPYFALQLKAITLSFEMLTGRVSGDGPGGLPDGTTLLVTAAMAVFALLFGVRSVNANEPHRGLMLAVAVESVIKLAAALLVGGAITFAGYGSPGALLDAVAARPDLAELLSPASINATTLATVGVAALAFLCLPRQFHVAIVENTHPADVRTAAWAFPVYLVAINLFVLPVALVGLLIFPDGRLQPDSFMVAIPHALGWDLLAFVAFLGGLSASTGMIIVATLALGTMVSNDLLLPVFGASPKLRARWTDNPAPALMAARRIAVLGILAMAYVCHRMLGPGFPLAAIGLISFVAVAQFAPALLIGLAWRRATAAGAAAGIVAGFCGWTWTVAVPALTRAGWLPATLLTEGPGGIAALSPIGIGGWHIDPQIHGILWSLGPNVFLLLVVSLLTRPSAAETLQAERFVGRSGVEWRRATPARVVSRADLHALAARFVGRERADAAFQSLAGDESVPSTRLGQEEVQTTERLLAGAIGSASARVVVASLVADRGLSRLSARAIIDDASRAILGQHETLRDALQTIRQGFCVFDADFRVTLWNRRFLELLDLPSELVHVGTSLEEIVRYNEARDEYAQAQFDSLITRFSIRGRRDKPDVYERRRPDGRVLEISTNPMESGGFVAVYTDVTERHQAAAALREANEALEARVQERTLALSAAKAEAERANRGKTRFLAAAGHDLLQPLQAARLFLSALKERSPDPAVRQIDTALNSVEHLLGELLEVSKLDSGVTRPNLTAFRLSDILVPLCAEFSALAEARGLGFRQIATSTSVQSDPVLLRRILQNLLANALRYTDRGRVMIGCRRRGTSISIEVWDTGPGIPEDKQREIFMEFHRLEQGKGEGEGLGLGLSIVERLADLMDHQVEVRSRPGHGSCFSVVVPQAPAPVPPQPAAARIERGFGGALVVFIENEPAIARAMVDLLTGWSCVVVTAPTPEGALDALAGRTPDALLSDYHLDHGKTGLAAIGLLRDRLGDIAATLITADRDPVLREAVEAKGFRLLYKPVRPGALRALLGQMLAERARAAAEADTGAQGSAEADY